LDHLFLTRLLTDLAEHTKPKKRKIEISEAGREAAQEGASQTPEKQSQVSGILESRSPSPTVPKSPSRPKGKERTKDIQETRPSPLVHDTKTSPPTLTTDAVDEGEEELDDEEADDDIGADKAIGSKRLVPAITFPL